MVEEEIGIGRRDGEAAEERERNSLTSQEKLCVRENLSHAHEKERKRTTSKKRELEKMSKEVAGRRRLAWRRQVVREEKFLNVAQEKKRWGERDYSIFFFLNFTTNRGKSDSQLGQPCYMPLKDHYIYIYLVL